jgi:isochorismate hydrolase
MAITSNQAVNAEDSTLLLIDLQGNLARVVADSGVVIQNVVRLRAAADLLKVPFLLTEQNASKLGRTIDEVAPVAPHCVFHKMHFDATLEPAFAQWFAGANRQSVLIAGTEAHVCVLQTAMGLLRMGYRVAMIEDACGSRTTRNHAAALRRAQQAGCELLTTEMVLFEWLSTAEHAQFREVLNLIK